MYWRIAAMWYEVSKYRLTQTAAECGGAFGNRVGICCAHNLTQKHCGVAIKELNRAKVDG